MNLESVGRLILLIGIGLGLIGGFLLLLSRIPLFQNLGNLPGDIHIEGQGFSCVIPLMSMCLISVLLTVIINILARLLNH